MIQFLHKIMNRFSSPSPSSSSVILELIEEADGTRHVNFPGYTYKRGDLKLVQDAVKAHMPKADQDLSPWMKL